MSTSTLAAGTLRKFTYPDPTHARTKAKNTIRGRKPTCTACKGGDEVSTIELTKPNRAQSAEIAAVHERLKAAAKAQAPVTRRAAAQLREDLFQWERWTLEGVALPRLPRRIRVGLEKAVKAKKSPARKNNLRKRSRKSPTDIKSVNKELSQEDAREIVAVNRGACMAIAQAIIGRYRLAEECVSECMVSALEQIAEGKVKFTSPDKATAWLHQIVRFSARRVMRKAVYIAASDVDSNVADTPLGEDIEDKIQINDKWADELAYRSVGHSKTLQGHGPDA